jgi:DNA-binding ferritin-like protein
MHSQKIYEVRYNPLGKQLTTEAKDKAVSVTTILLTLSAAIKNLHWSTKDYSLHKLTDDIHDDLTDITDSYTEKMIAIFGVMPSTPDAEVYTKEEVKDMYTHYYDVIIDVNDYMKSLHSSVSSPICSLLDDIAELLSNQLYLLDMN